LALLSVPYDYLMLFKEQYPLGILYLVYHILSFFCLSRNKWRHYKKI